MRRTMLLGFMFAALLAPAVWGAETNPAAPKGKPALLVMDVQNA